MSFESELIKGIFCIPECTYCKITIWPPTEFCGNCFKKISLKKENIQGKIIEYSKDEKGHFCLVEFDKTIKILAKTTTTPKIGKKVTVVKCGIVDDNYYFLVN